MKKVMIATGGSGGHIFPALAFAQVLKEEEPNCEIVFFGSSNHMESEMIPSYGYRFIGQTMEGLYGSIFHKAKAVGSIYFHFWNCIKMFKNEKPEACVAFGNYISVPFILAAKYLKIPTMIHEQNSSAGKANKMLGKVADAIVTSYASTEKDFPVNKTRLYGNPEATVASRENADQKQLEEYGIDTNRPYILAMMGSLGSSSVAKVLDESCHDFDSNYQTLLVVGKQNEYNFKSENDKNIKIVPFVDGKLALRYCTLAILRAGATTLSEVTTLGVPTILIPSPYVPNNHQLYNAMELVQNKAAVLIEEKDLNPTVLAGEVNHLLTHEEVLEKMRENAQTLGKPNAAYDMIAWLKELTKHG